MFNNLTRSQKQSLTVLGLVAASAIVTFTLDGTIMVLAYMMIGLSYSALGILSNPGEKEKNDA